MSRMFLATRGRDALDSIRRRFFYRRPGVKLIHDLDNPDVLARWKAALERDRQTPRYRAVFRKKRPLVSVCITTSDRAEILRERALTTIRNQTYDNLDVVIVGDRCDDHTETVVASFRDPRFTFRNLKTRGPYPRPGIDRWRVAGTNALNLALQRAIGDLVTHLDEDDTYEPHRIETLVRELQRTEADLVFHPFSWENEDKSWTVRGNGRFEHGKTGTGLVLYHNWFAKIPWDVNAFRFREPGDWNRLRKFKSLGARTHYVDQVLSQHWMYPQRGPFVPKPGETFLD